jgi:hypothetical protein
MMESSEAMWRVPECVWCVMMMIVYCRLEFVIR